MSAAIPLQLVNDRASLRARACAAPVRRPRRGLAALRGIQGVRRLVQVSAAGAIGWFVIQRAVAPSSGSSVSPESICPFGGIETIATFLTTGSFVPHVHPANVVLAAAVVALAFFARGAFCGWICPLGFAQDAVASLSASFQRRFPIVRRGVRAVRRRGARLAVLDRPMRLLKYVVLAWSIWGAASFGVMVFRDVDPWIALLNIGRESAGFGLLVLAVVLLGSAFVDRPWCRYACPLGAVNGIVGRFSPVRLERSEAACVDCNLCTKSCPMGLPVATAPAITSADCIGCLQCVEACPREGVLELRMGLPI